MTFFGLKWGQDLGMNCQEYTPHIQFNNYSKHPLIKTRGKNLPAEISLFNTPEYKNLFSQARSNSVIDGYYDKQSNQGV